ncbi:Outer membrane receptor proteins, mostly Fe transport [Bizionia echini]|uniref:Outer membrane receptor proteins, mostly Fe transport n=1 Tax=Bizionia echini TaxID=649333 RepID=A0A1I5BJR9_9FLAO|nr:TonB-dependent receptor [Bizionia echini]SFN74963.1 Outer membrane receptor proteins, mostly Fe transport [Bizionia echini]
MKTKNTFKFIFFLIVSQLVQAQTIKGTVSDEEGKPIENAYIYNINSTSHAHSLSNGSFIIENNQIGDSLSLGLLGYEKRTVVVVNEYFQNGLQVTLNSKTVLLNELVITEQVNAMNSISRVDLETNPVNSSQEILRKVPGLIIGQHAGGGKAEQIFLRGFDIDHGTDISLSVDGMPVNMVSHAHGQGYSDLHFLIPETINNINFGKGPYYANKGDFATAGYVDFNTKDQLNGSEISLSYGQFNSLRTLGMFDLLKNNKRSNAYVALEYIEFDGPFESPQNFNRLNLFGKFSTYLKGNDKLSLTVSHFTSRWDASGQIPQRAVDSGLISRFGAIDDTEGGNTSRSNVNVAYDAILKDDLQFKANVFYTKYAFELYSNFTFFLEDPINGDQIKQYENRDIFGFNKAFIKDTKVGSVETKITSGFGLRYDQVNDVELSHTLNRSETLDNLALGNVNETNMFGFVNAEFKLNKFIIAPALRLDYFKFMYNDALVTDYETLSETKTTVSPKLNFFYNQNNNLQWFLKSGIGFHSNDTRVVVAQSGEDILPKAYGVDLGAIWKPFPKMVVNTALWYLFLEQEFVYVGDAGIVEPSGQSERYGVDLGLRYQFTDWLYFDTDATITHARSVEEPDGFDYIPLAPDFTLTGGLSVNDLNGFSAGIRYRYIDDRPANEDNSIIAEGYFVTDLNMNYAFNKNFSVGVAIENVFDTEWNETQFATESRLQNEIDPVEEIHFTPGTPFFIKGIVSYKF